MLVYVDILSGKEVGSDSYPSEVTADGAVISMQSEKTLKGGEKIDIGANASADPDAEPEEGADDQSEQVINIVDTHELMKIDFTKKDFSATIKSYYKTLLKALNSAKYEALNLGRDYEAPKDKDEAKAAIAEATAKLDKFEKMGADAADAAIQAFKKNFPAIEAWVKDVCLANFEEFEFYIPEGGEIGQCIILPARYIGEATAPTFYVISNGVRQEKA